ncbi:hypothetical protein GOODEAATRI_014835 [Goodea atripinnis]|uniref:Uncharacterized protein n=1 Tax=Goodea atripinnis TaxID=208336 RepID=A0ABV0PYT8_9TELE
MFILPPHTVSREVKKNDRNEWLFDKQVSITTIRISASQVVVLELFQICSCRTFLSYHQKTVFTLKQSQCRIAKMELNVTFIFKWHLFVFKVGNMSTLIPETV